MPVECLSLPLRGFCTEMFDAEEVLNFAAAALTLSCAVAESESRQHVAFDCHGALRPFPISMA